MKRLKLTLDKDLEKITHVEAASRSVSSRYLGFGVSLMFMGLAGLLAATSAGVSLDTTLVVVAAMLGGYMALNIGANDVANNVGPAVGARAMNMVGALVLAAVCESAGALLAGGDVVTTVASGIIDPALVSDNDTFVLAMMAALVSAAVWINLATWIGAPVSTTHSVVGGVMGAGIAAVGFGLINWPTMGAIAASWVISPVLGGVIAALFLAFIKSKIIYRSDKIAAARRWIPVLVAVMAAAFTAYLFLKGLKQVWHPASWVTSGASICVFLVTWLVVHPVIRRQSEGMENRNKSLRALFRIPLICAAALLSFAHGANDVANAVGPVAAILHTVTEGSVTGQITIPIWIMMIGAFGISLGLFLYGPKLIRMVGARITRMNPMRAYCVALSAAITVIIASGLGLPVSSTHIAVGAVFGVGFFREFYTARRSRQRRRAKRKTGGVKASETETTHRKLVRRSHFLTIIAAWVTTVPAAAVLSALVYTVLQLVL